MTALRNIGAIVGKEWRHYFGSPIAYITLFVWLALYGLFVKAGQAWLIGVGLI